MTKDYFNLKLLKDIKDVSKETMQYRIFLSDLLRIGFQIEHSGHKLNDDAVVDIEGMEEELTDMQKILDNMQFKLIVFKKQ